MSHADTVALKNVSDNTTGRYRCEVLSDAPYFESATTARNITVIRKSFIQYTIFMMFWQKLVIEPFFNIK